MIRGDTSPPLYYLLLRGWVGMFGHSEVAMRSLSAVFSSAALLVFYGIARRLLRDRWAVTAAMCLAAVSCMGISYAHEARFYTLTLLLAMTGFYLVVLVAERSTLWRLGLLTAVWIVSLYTANTLSIYLAAMGVAWLILPGSTPVRRRFIDLSIVMAIAAIAFLPWLPTMLAQTRAIHGNFWPSPPDRWDLAQVVAIMCGVNTLPSEQITLIVLNAALVVILIWGLFNPAIRRSAIALTIVAFAPVLLVFVVSLISQPIFIERILLPTALFAPLLIVMILNSVATGLWRWVGGGAVLVLLILSVRSIGDIWLGAHPEPWREISQFVDADRSNHPLIIFAANESELLYDYYSRNFDYSPSPRLLGLPSGFFDIDPPKTMRRVLSDADLTRLRAALPRDFVGEVILVESHPWWADPEGRIPEFLNQRMRLIGQQKFSHTTVYRYSSVR